MPKNTQTEVPKEKKATPSKQERLVRLANARVPKAVKSISLLGNLAAYGPTEEQAQKIVSAMQIAVEAVADKLRTTNTTSQPSTFSL